MSMNLKKVFYFNGSLDFEVKYEKRYDSILFSFDGTDYDASVYHVNYIHDFTAELFNDGDVPIGHLTPDKVIGDKIIEFSTQQTVNTSVLDDAFDLKFTKYANLAVKNGYNLTVIIIGKDKVVSNDDLTQEYVDQLIKRYNFILNLKETCSLDLNRELWPHGTESKMRKILNEVLSESYVVKSKSDFERTMDRDMPEFTNDMFVRVMSEITKKMKTTKFDISSNHTLDYHPKGERTDLKRCIPFPLFISSKYAEVYEHRSDILKPDLRTTVLSEARHLIINQAKTNGLIHYQPETEFKIAVEQMEVPKQKVKKMFQFKVKLNLTENIELALSGVQAKRFKDTQEIMTKRFESKKTFDYSTSTDDIDEFINMDTMSLLKTEKSDFFCKKACQDWFADLNNYNAKTRRDSKYSDLVMLEDFDEISQNDLMNYVIFIQAIATEINLSVRDNLNQDMFIVKPIPGFHADLYLKVVGSNKPIFFFIVSKIRTTFGPETVGVKYHVTKDGYAISDWSSIKLRDVENYLAITSTMLSTIAYLKQLKMDYSVMNQHINFILLVALSNKDRDEELITLLRYIYMRSLSHTDNVTTLTSKLPTFFRSRLNIFQTKKLVTLMQKLHVEKPYVKKIDNERDVFGLMDIFGNVIDFKQALNFCYYGYVVNKTKQTEENQSSKLVDKILEFDLKVNQGHKLFGVEFDELEDHYHNNDFLTVMIKLAEIKIKENYGDNYKQRFMESFINHMSRQNFMTLATIKASSKLQLPNGIDESSLKMLKSKRPKVVESLNYIFKCKPNVSHPMELVNFCIKEIDTKDCFNVELFSKDQHAGIREIYVVDIRVRIIQWFVEIVSRSLCSLFESETMTNPKMKDYKSQNMARSAIIDMEDPIMLCRSGDASKWSQTQNVTKFYNTLKPFLPEEFHQIIKSILKLWFRKKIFLPAGLIEICKKPLDFKVMNKSVNFISGVYNGEKTDWRLKRNSPFLRIRTGFMQGILHFTSSFFHTIVQEGFWVFKDFLIGKIFPEHKKRRIMKNIILQGSDDNSEVIIVSRDYYKKHRNLFKILVQIKDIMSGYLGIKVSKEKTASCVPFLMEYNSMWELAGKFVMPTIKFVFVACDIPNKQTMVGRQEFYYSLLTNCLEKGATIRTCNLIRLAQCEQHYLQLGLHHNQLFNRYYNELKPKKSPSLGYFMFELPLVTGILGFDFMLYFHCTETSFFAFVEIPEREIPSQILVNLGYKSIEDFTIGKHNFDNFNKIRESLSLGSVEVSREKINKAPEILYQTINNPNQEWALVNLKMNNFSVKESLSSRFSKSDMFSSLIYILSRPVCFYQGTKHSLIKLIVDLQVIDQTRLKVRKSFTRHNIYRKILDDLRLLLKENDLQDKEYVQRGSSSIVVLEGLNNDSFKLIDLCKYKWFGFKTISLCEQTLENYFNEMKAEIPWLRDTEEETKNHLTCDSFELYMYLMNTFKDERKIRLLDTPGKQGNLNYLITRILDVNKKLVYKQCKMSQENKEKLELRSNIKFLVEFPYSHEFKTSNLRKMVDDYMPFVKGHDEKTSLRMIQFLLWNDEQSLIRFIIDNSNSLSLAVFTKRQKFDETTRAWKGDGAILCKNHGLIYEIIIFDQTIKWILVKDIKKARDNYRHILSTLQDMSLEITSEICDKKLRLNKSGLFMDCYGVEIKEERTLSFRVDSINNVSLRYENNRVKIVTVMQSKLLNNSTMIDNLDHIRSHLVRNNQGQEFWVSDNVLKTYDFKPIKTLNKSAQDVEQIITLTSFRTTRFVFTPDYSPRFEVSPFIKFFWNRCEKVENFYMFLTDYVKRNSIKNHEELLFKEKLDGSFPKKVKNLISGKSYDKKEEIVNALLKEEVDEQINVQDLSSIHDSLAIWITDSMKDDDDNLFNLLQPSDGIMDLDFEIDDTQLDSLLETMDELTKTFFIKFSSSEILEGRFFSNLKFKILMSLNGDVSKFQHLLSEGKHIDELNLSEQVILKFLCNFKLNEDQDDELMESDLHDEFYHDPNQLDNMIRGDRVLNLQDKQISDVKLLIKIVDDKVKQNLKNMKEQSILLFEKKNILRTIKSDDKYLTKLKLLLEKNGIIYNPSEEEEETNQASQEIDVEAATQDNVPQFHETDSHFQDILSSTSSEESEESKESDDTEELIDFMNIINSFEETKKIISELVDTDDQADVDVSNVINAESALSQDQKDTQENAQQEVIEEDAITKIPTEAIDEEADCVFLGQVGEFKRKSSEYIKENFEIINVTGTGDCLFLALAISMLPYRSHAAIGHTIKSLRDFIVDNYNLALPIEMIAGKESYGEQFPENLREIGEWGDSSTITVFARLFEVNVTCFTKTFDKEGNEFYFENSKIVGESTWSKTYYDVYVNFTDGCHYRAMIKKEDIPSLKSQFLHYIKDYPENEFLLDLQKYGSRFLMD